ncbi:MAG: nucleotidyltransferase family protein [Gammaproteobacteria bacterium]
MSRLAEQIQQAVAAFEGCKTPPALIGGVALAAHEIVRATRDVDFLVDAADADHLHAVLTKLGYQCRYRSRDTANYIRGDEGLDLIYAHRPKSRQLLAGSMERDTALGRLRVISAEGLIGLKLQALVNNPSRRVDQDDILALLRAHRARLNMDELRSYFALFDREELLDEWLADIAKDNG